MMPFRSHFLVVYLSTLGFAHSLNGDVINFDDFSDTSQLTMLGTAVGNVDNGIDPNPVLRLVDRSEVFSIGAAYYENTLDISRFSTTFDFRFHDPTGGGADGILLLINAAKTTGPNSGGDLGFRDLQNAVAVEFDIFHNPEHGDPDGNHIGVDINGGVTSAVNGSPGFLFEGVQATRAFIDYDGSQLEVRVSQDGLRPVLPDLTFQIDIPSHIGAQSGFVGLIGVTGGQTSNHDIINWRFADANSIPEPATAVLLFVFSLALFSSKGRRSARLQSLGKTSC